MQTLNFNHLKDHDPYFIKLAYVAEHNFIIDSNTTLLKLRQLGEAFIKYIASDLGIIIVDIDSQFDILNNIKEEAHIDYKILNKFHKLRQLGNEANHKFTDNPKNAKEALRLAWKLSIWFDRVYGSPSADWRPGTLKIPQHQDEQIYKLKEQVALLEKTNQESNQKATEYERKHQELLAYQQAREKQEEDNFKTVEKQFEILVYNKAQKNKTDEKARNKAKEKLEKTHWNHILFFLGPIGSIFTLGLKLFAIKKATDIYKQP